MDNGAEFSLRQDQYSIHAGPCFISPVIEDLLLAHHTGLSLLFTPIDYSARAEQYDVPHINCDSIPVFYGPFGRNEGAEHEQRSRSKPQPFGQIVTTFSNVDSKVSIAKDHQTRRKRVSKWFEASEYFTRMISTD